MNRSFNQIQSEFAQNDVHGFLWSWLHDLVIVFARGSIVPRYKAAIYSPSGRWDDEGLSDLANGFIVDRVVEGGLLVKGLTQTKELALLTGYLTKSFRRYVIDQRPLSMARNIFDRLRGTLDNSPEFARMAGVPPRSYYGLVQWADDPPEIASQLIVRDASEHVPADIAWSNYDKGDRHSPGLVSRDLQRIAIALLKGTGRLMTAQQIMFVIGRRFDLQTLDELTAAPNADVAGLDSPFEDIEAKDLAARLVALCSPRQRQVLFQMLDQGDEVTARSLALALDISKSLAATERQHLQQLFRSVGASGERQMRQLLDAIGAMRQAG